jgi:hypothetical protein
MIAWLQLLCDVVVIPLLILVLWMGFLALVALWDLLRKGWQ